MAINLMYIHLTPNRYLIMLNLLLVSNILLHNINNIWIEYLIEFTTYDSNVFCNGENPSNNNTAFPENPDNQQTGRPGNNNNNNSSGHLFYNNNKDDDDTLPYDTEEDRERLRACMLEKLSTHRVSCADKATPYTQVDTRLDEKFLSQEHEYVCDNVMQYKAENPRSQYHNHITGDYPDRKYNGPITPGFIAKVFGRK